MPASIMNLAHSIK